MKIYIDVGHGGSDVGAVGNFEGYRIIERDLNLVMAFELEKELGKYKDVETLLSRRSNDLSVQFDANGIDGSASRCNLWGTYNDQPVDLMVSVHNNGFNGKNFGHVLLTSLRHANELAFKISEQYSALGQPCMGIFYVTYSGKWIPAARYLNPQINEPDFHGIIRQTVKPNITDSIIIESMYVDNHEDVTHWVWDEGSGEYRMGRIRQLMEAVAKGIAKYYNLEPVEVAPPATEVKPVWKGIQSSSVSFDRVEGDKAIVEVVINGHITMVELPLEKE